MSRRLDLGLSAFFVSEIEQTPAAPADEKTAGKFARNMVQLAGLLGVERKTIQRWLKEPGNPGKRSDGRFHVEDWRQWREVNGKKIAPNLTDLNAELIEKRIEKLTIENKAKRGIYIEREKVEIWAGEMIGQMKKVLLSGPSSLAPQVVGVTVPEAESMLREWLHQALSQLSAQMEARANEEDAK